MPDKAFDLAIVDPPTSRTEQEGGMKAYKIQTPYNYSQTIIVIAKNMGDAEKTFLNKYPQTTILEITKISDYVEIQDKD